MTRQAAPAIWHVRPDDPERTAIAPYAEDFAKALRAMPGHATRPFFDAPVSEKIDSLADRRAIERFVGRQCGNIADSPETIIHVEIGNALHREFWAGYFLQRRLSRARFFCTLHDPPRLTSNPYRYVPVEFAGRTPFRLADIALTWTAERIAAMRARHVERAFLRRCNGIIVLSEAARALLRADPRLKNIPLHAIPLVISPPDMPRQTPRSGPLQMVCFSFISPSKDYLCLIEAFEKFHRQVAESASSPAARLKIAGGIAQGFEARKFLAQITDRIAQSPCAQWIDFAPGFITDAERDDLLESADILVLPARETPGVVFSSASAVRALSLGRAVVAADCNTMRELISDGANGLLYQEANAESLAERLTSLVQSGELREKLARTARERIERVHSPLAVADRLGAIYANPVAPTASNQ